MTVELTPSEVDILIGMVEDAGVYMDDEQKAVYSKLKEASSPTTDYVALSMAIEAVQNEIDNGDREEFNARGDKVIEILARMQRMAPQGT